MQKLPHLAPETCLYQAPLDSLLETLDTGVSETTLKYSLKCKQSLTSLRLFPEILEINMGPLQTQLYGTNGLQNVTAHVKSERF